MGIRYIKQGHFKDQSGNVVASGNVTVYPANGTTGAIIYASSGAVGAVSGSVVTSSTDVGYWSFWIDTDDYLTSQRFKIVLSKTGFSSQTYDDMVIYPDFRISSSDVTVTGNLLVKGTINTSGLATFQNTVACSSKLSVSASASFSAKVGITGTLACSTGLNVTKNIASSGAFTAKNTITGSSKLSVTNAITGSSKLSVTNAITGSSKLSISGTAIFSRNINATEASYGVLKCNTIQVKNSAASPPDANAITKENIIKAWVNFASNGSINGSFNVSSVTDMAGAGAYTVNWDTDFANVNYVVAGIIKDPTGGGGIFIGGNDFTVSAAHLLTTDYAGTAKDVAINCVIAIGDQ